MFATVSDARMAGAQGIREEIMGRFAERIAKDCNGRFAMLDFFEVRFDLAFARFRKSVLRQIGPSSVLTEPLSTETSGGGMHSTSTRRKEITVTVHTRFALD